MIKDKKDLLNRIRKQEKSDIDDVSHWEKFDLDTHVTVYFAEHNCSWDEAVEAVRESYNFNSNEYIGVKDVSDFIDDDLVREIIDSCK